MSLFRRVLESTKIEPDIQAKQLALGKVIGFRGVRENLGTTTLMTHVARELESKGYDVCVLDLDFNSPNPLMCPNKCNSFLKKWNYSKSSVNDVYNKSKVSGNITYIGASEENSIIEFLPTFVNVEYLNQKAELFEILFNELKMHFDVILVDMVPDLRNIEVTKVLGYCNEVITTTAYDKICLSKLQRDTAVLSGIGGKQKTTTLVQITEFVEIDNINLSDLNPDYKKIATVYKSSNIAQELIDGKVKLATEAVRIKDYNEHMYYKGVLDIVKYLEGKSA